MRLSSDWRGADFIAQHIDGITFLPVQLKGRLTFARKYEGRGLHVCFPDRGEWFLYPHDDLLAQVRSEEHTSELQSRSDLVCRLLLEKKKTEALYLVFS